MGWMEKGKTPDNVVIDLGGFWPKIESGKFFDQYRPPSELPVDTVLDQLRQAAARVRHDLQYWRDLQTDPTLADVEQDTIDGMPEKVMLFERAVYCEAKAELLKETQTADRRPDAENVAKTGAETEDKYREFAADAVSLIVGDDRIHVGVI